mmetsp:Transcript_88016/g.244311  ORF Transcript_88016/g.244311 Transcript_88016/m.244311 type:complete len:464 (+) Transcript_88016:210-1601(+)|eukprot:CAMPEP_0179122098 /NCGR_PEP_ID=MMETSP0796-20121207/57613_1 /TAXON_ID=73915 /ORGANISM="Pyrodinium bahamense, Strain pbaha01" /LENGTH=463 /DNA_ID=CAMNT_0020820715 /DNA_START=188 /DNA_END=1579 /DNA_ORIENTATION=+
MDRNATIIGGCSPSSYSFALWNLVIRPPRAAYHTWQLGPTEFTVNGVRAVRRDFKLQATNGGYLACSHYLPRKNWDQEPLQKCPVIVYLHGNSSNRLEAVAMLGPLLAQGISLCCFDSAGCGHSDGEYISLGWHERDDLATILEYLRQSPFCGPVGLWGRSMGAATALLHADRDQTLGAICLDSPFVSLRKLVEDLATSTHVICPLPHCIVILALAIIRLRVKTLANFDIEDVVPLEHAKRSYVPAIFMHARQDTFISPGHSRQLYDAYLGDKEFVLIDGDHNTERSAHAIDRAIDFFCRAFRVGDMDLSLAPDVFGAATPSNTGNRASGLPKRSLTPPLQPQRVSPLLPPAPPTPPPAANTPAVTQLPLQVEDSEEERSPRNEAWIRIDFSPDWQRVMDHKLEQAGIASAASKKRLLVTDNTGVLVNLFSGNRGAVPAPSRFPLTIELIPPCTGEKAACGGG